MFENPGQREQILFAASQTIAASLELEQVYRAIHHAAAQLMPAEVFLITLLVPDNAEIELVYQYDSDGRGPTRRFPANRGITGHVLATGQPLRVADLEQETFDTMLVIGTQLPRAVLAAPLRHGEATLGMLSAQSYVPAVYTAADESVLVLLANQAAQAIVNARLYAEVRAQTEQLRLMDDITRIALETNNAVQMLKAVADQIRVLMGADECFISQWDAERQRSIPTASFDKYPHYQPAQDDEVTITRSVIRAGHALAIEDVRSTPYVSPRIIGQFPALCSALGLPLIADGQNLGAIVLAYNTPQRFTSAEIARGEQVAARVSLALAKVLLYQKATAERSHLHALLEASQDGVALIGFDRKIWVLNAAMMQLLRLPGEPAAWLQRPVTEALQLLHTTAPEVVQQGEAEMQRMTLGNEPGNTGRIELFGRQVQWFNLPVFAATQALGRLVLLRDVTEAHLTQQMHDSLTHMLVHDLRSPLSGVYLSLVMLSDDVHLGGKSRELLRLAEQNVVKLRRLVDAILDINQIESGQLPLRLQAVPLATLLGRALQTQTVAAQAKGLRLEVAEVADLPQVLVDEELVERVLQNLVGNALKFTEQGQVRVSAQRTGADTRWLEVQVSDTGPGIPPDLQARLFQKFARGNSRLRGSGLGLAFCRLVIEAHGGYIRATSVVGEGTVFVFTLPLGE